MKLWLLKRCTDCILLDVVTVFVVLRRTKDIGPRTLLVHTFSYRGRHQCKSMTSEDNSPKCKIYYWYLGIGKM